MTYDVNSYLASLMGQQSVLQSQYNSKQNQLSSLQAQRDSLQIQYNTQNSQGIFNQSLSDQINSFNVKIGTLLSSGGDPNSNDPGYAIKKQLDLINAQVNSAKQVSSSVPVPRTTPSISIPSIPITFPSLSTISPILLIGAGIFLFLLLI